MELLCIKMSKNDKTLLYVLYKPNMSNNVQPREICAVHSLIAISSRKTSDDTSERVRKEVMSRGQLIFANTSIQK